MRKHWIGAVLIVCLASCAMAQLSSNVHALRPFKQGEVPNLTGIIDYNGGPVFEKTPTIYIVWYGTWTKKDKSVIDGYFAHLGGTTMSKINTRYSDSANKFVPITVHHTTANDYHDNYSMGHSVNDAGIQQIAANAISGHHLPADKNGIYFVLTAKDVTDSDGFCSFFCGYHGPSSSIVPGDIIKYSMVGNAISQCPSGCVASVVLGDTTSPNNDPGADGVVNVMWHEFSETVSDPEVNLQTAWAGNNCGESGDCCAWFFGTTHIAGNGSHYTNTIGGKHYIAQTMLELNTKARGIGEPGTCKNTF